MGGDDTWTIRRAHVDDERFGPHRLGPYRLGPPVRRTALGEVLLGLHDQNELIVEIELLHVLTGTPLAEPESPLLADLAQAMGLAHRHLAPLVGAGFADGSPYVVRPHRPGRTLAELEAQPSHELEPDAAMAISYAVAEAVEYAAEQGPEPGACVIGGFDARDVLLGFDGGVWLLGAGTRAARGALDPRAADRESLLQLAERLDRWSGARAAAAIRKAPEGAAARALRKSAPEACAKQRELVAGALRRAFDEAIWDERAFFGLPRLQ